MGVGGESEGAGWVVGLKVRKSDCEGRGKGEMKVREGVRVK